MSSVLLVDEEDLIREIVMRWLVSLGYEPREATNADDALRLMSESASEVAICGDISTPGRDGLWLAERLRSLYPDTAVVMATGSQDVDAALNSIQVGVIDYLAKPFTREQLRTSIRLGVDWNRNALRSRRRAAALEVELRERLAPLADSISRNGIASDAELDEQLQTVYLDRVTYEHSRRVVAISMNVALALGLRSPELSDIERAALLHDVGRHALPKAILSKPSALSKEETAVVHLQPQLAYEILRHCPFLAPAAEIVRSAFEHVDGSGYPWGLKGEEIPIGARIINAADAFDAMTHQRLHRDARALPEALFEIHRCRGTQFDNKVVDALLKVASLHWHRGAAKVVSGERVGNPAGLHPGAAHDADMAHARGDLEDEQAGDVPHVKIKTTSAL